MSRTISSERPLEDLLLEHVELVADLAQHGEAVVEAVIDEAVEQIAGPAWRRAARGSPPSGGSARTGTPTGCSGWLGIVIRKPGPTKRSSSPASQPPRAAVEDRELEDDEQVVVIDVDLRPLVAREGRPRSRGRGLESSHSEARPARRRRRSSIFTHAQPPQAAISSTLGACGSGGSGANEPRRRPDPCAVLHSGRGRFRTSFRPPSGGLLLSSTSIYPSLP